MEWKNLLPNSYLRAERAVHQQMHTRTHTAYHIQFGKWFSGPSSAKTPVFVTVQQSGHGATPHIHTLRQVLLPSNKNIVSHPQAIRCVSTVSGNRAMEQLLHKWCLCVLPKLITSVDKVRYICSSSTLRVFVNRLRRSVSLWRVKTQLLWQFTLIQRVC